MIGRGLIIGYARWETVSGMLRRQYFANPTTTGFSMDMTLGKTSSEIEFPTQMGLLSVLKPYIAVVAVTITGTILVVAIYYTLLDLAWIAFLGGILVASILAMSTQATRVALSSEETAGKLTLSKYLLGKEMALREGLDSQLAVAKGRLHYSDEMLPAMLAFVGTGTRYQYYNRAFRNWVGMPSDRMDGHHMREVLGRTAFAEIEPYVLEAESGRMVRYERTQMTPDGRSVRLAVQFLPQVGGDGTLSGFHVVMTDITAIWGEARPKGPDPVSHDDPEESAAAAWNKARKSVLAAINGDEFALFCQRITSVAKGGPVPDLHEVLIRLREEESGHIPPGAFFALAEEYGLLPQLDRWVFEHVFQWMVSPVGVQTVLAGELYFINVAPATLSDPGFPDFVELHLRMTGAAGHSVCIEICEADLIQHEGDAVAFVRKIREHGCKIAISGFSHNRLAMRILRLIQVDFLKIDGSIVRQVATYPVQFNKVVAIARLAKNIGVLTIAEMVEDSQTVGILGDAGVDYAQGFGIAVPKRLEDVVPFSRASPDSSPRRAA